MWKCGFGLAQPSAAGPSSPLLVLCCLLPKSEKRYKHIKKTLKLNEKHKENQSLPHHHKNSMPDTQQGVELSIQNNLYDEADLRCCEKSSFSCKQNPLRSSSDQMKALNKYCMLYIMLQVSGSVLLKVDKIPGVLKELSTA